jgi:RimJ/RimL family protein N-acetyltransferase
VSDFRPSTQRDLDFVLASERHPDNAPTVGASSEQAHRSWLAEPDVRHVIVGDGAGARVGFLILRGLMSPHDSIELFRIVINDKGRGHGRRALRWAKRFAFEESGAHRLWLDVSPFNARARGLYRSEGFVEEGTLRECQRWGDRYESLVIMSLLAHEHRGADHPSPGGP